MFLLNVILLFKLRFSRFPVSYCFTRVKYPRTSFWLTSGFQAGFTGVVHTPA